MVRLRLVDAKYLPTVVDAQEFEVEEDAYKHIILERAFTVMDRPHRIDREKSVDEAGDDHVISEALVVKAARAQLVVKICQEINDIGWGGIGMVGAAVDTDLLVTHWKFGLDIIISEKVDTGVTGSDKVEQSVIL